MVDSSIHKASPYILTRFPPQFTPFSNSISKIGKSRWPGRGSKSKDLRARTFGQVGYGETSKNTVKTGNSNTPAPQLHHGTEMAISDADLMEVVKSWPTFTPAKRRVILGIVRGG
jgi:hypothetical protein